MAPFFARLSDSADKKNTFYQPKQYKSGNKTLPQNLSFFTKTKGITFPSLFFDKTSQQAIKRTHHDKKSQPGLSINFDDLFHPFLSPVCSKSGNSYNVNSFRLDFLFYTGKEKSGNMPIPSANPDNGKEWYFFYNKRAVKSAFLFVI